MASPLTLLSRPASVLGRLWYIYYCASRGCRFLNLHPTNVTDITMVHNNTVHDTCMIMHANYLTCLCSLKASRLHCNICLATKLITAIFMKAHGFHCSKISIFQKIGERFVVFYIILQCGLCLFCL